ncbi:xanthine dehydrogenase small subunit [Ideonella alba]|uniref:Xanthine dehydrogenase small subunit n=1 Tax=Ideonella alba TaxID=2824118 RepID=A0A940YC01_9BURK|nr:xanthine dehydrogenase small subunit [Ideonella alba]MBQ0929570.1 xanthine dehydrogenase small subunit [Ideonella alba]
MDAHPQVSPEAATRPVRFVFRGRTVEVNDAPPTRSVLQWLREDARACGTKEGCAEGDCGACTVLVAELAELAETVLGDTAAVRSAGLAIRPVNACIRFLPSLDGKALLTVEDLAGPSPDAPLHPAQQALVDCHGHQCGFCTPGFAMSLAAEHERQRAGGPPPSRSELADAIAGNLCRCTGYRPILDAGQRMGQDLSRGLPLDGLAEQLRGLQAAPALSLPGRWHAPRSLAELAALRAARPQARLLAGATDVGLWVTKQMRELGELIWLGDVAELRRIDEADGALRIGAAVTLEDGWRALVARWPTLSEMHRRFAAPPVRHAGTLVGNLANGSPIGDAPPVLMALGARLRLRQGEATRHLALEDFYLDYMKNALQPGEFIEAVEVPLTTADPAWVVRAWKQSKRFDCDISGVSAGLVLRVEQGVVHQARLAFGGMAATVRRATGAEAALTGHPWTEATLQAAQAALDTDFTPLTDLRASAPYRQRVARALLHRLWLDTRADAPLPASALRVWEGCA